MKKILTFISAIFLCCVFLSGCSKEINPTNYILNSDGNLIVIYDNGTTEDLGEWGDEIIDSLTNVEISDDGYYVINGVKTDIKAVEAVSYELDSDGNLIVTYSDGSNENLGPLGSSLINGIETISVSDDGYYIINGIETDIVAKESYTVKFDAGYSINIPDQKVLEGNKVTRPEIERTGYTLDGWFCNGEEWRFNSDVVLNNMELEAEWTANQYTITFETNGEYKLENITVTYDQPYNLPSLTKVGHEFLGWYNGTNKVSSDSVWNIANDVTLTAKWNANEYTITLDPNGGQVSQVSKKVTYGEMYKLPVPTNDFGEFKGWYYNEERITDENGNSLEEWTFVENITVSTNWITEIYTVEDLLNVKEALNGHYVLMANLDVSNISWMPIGNTPESLNGLTSSNFTGVIDGNGHTINGLTMTTYFESLNSYGFIGYNYGTIKNLKLTGVNINITGIKNDAYAGGICGYNAGNIINCFVSGQINISNHSGSYDSICGGIAGKSNAVSLKDSFVYSITDCYNEATVSAVTYAGGIVGFSIYANPYERCINKGNINSKYAGGIVGYSYGDKFIQCKNEGYVKGTQEAGGILGASLLDSISLFAESSFDQCVNKGKVETSNTADCEAGGIVGEIMTVNITNCYNYGEVKGHRVGGILGHSYYVDSVISNCLNNGSIYGYQHAGGILGWGPQIAITDCVNFGYLSSSMSKGHISGYNYTGTHTNCYYSYQSGTYSDADTSGVTKTSLNITDTELYKDYLYWDLFTLTNTDGIWVVDGTNNPYLAWEIINIIE